MSKENNGDKWSLIVERPLGAIDLNEFEEGMEGFFICNVGHILMEKPQSSKCPVPITNPERVITIPFCTRCGKKNPSWSAAGIGGKIHDDGACGGPIDTRVEFLGASGYKYCQHQVYFMPRDSSNNQHLGRRRHRGGSLR